MHRLAIRLLCLSALTLASACRGHSNVTLERTKGNGPVARVPDWYLEPPRSSTAIYAAATATSRDLDLAVVKARTEARQQLAEQVATRVDGLTKQLAADAMRSSGAQAASEAGELRQEFSRLSTQSTALTLYGVHPRDQVVRVEGQSYRAFVLLELPLESISRSLVTETQKRPELSERLRNSPTYQTLEREVTAARAATTSENARTP